MSFGGNAGPAGGMLAAAAMFTPDGLVSYDTDARSAVLTTSQNQRLAGQFGRFSILRPIVSFVEDLPNPLTQYIDGTIDGSASDTGVLVTAAPTKYQHGIPVNFGPGRGNWGTPENYGALKVLLTDCVLDSYGPPSSGRDWPLVMVDLVGATDVQIVVKSMNDARFVRISMWLEWQHTAH